VGWELAAQYIQTNPSDPNVKIHNNLNDLVACLIPVIPTPAIMMMVRRNGCQGLVDPDWVLKRAAKLLRQTRLWPANYG